MRKSWGKSGQFWVEAQERVLAFLRAEHPQKTAEAVYAQICGAGYAGSLSTVAKWFERASRPNFEGCRALIAAYGPRLLAVMLGPGFAWLDEACAIESRKQFAGQVEQLKAKFRVE